MGCPGGDRLCAVKEREWIGEGMGCVMGTDGVWEGKRGVLEEK
jgi:hypothetical protein